MANVLENCCPEFANACPDIEICGEKGNIEATEKRELPVPPSSSNDIENKEVCVKECKCLGEQRQDTDDNKIKVIEKQSETQNDPVSVNCVPAIISSLHCEPIMESLKSVYKTDYEKKRFLILPYKRLIASFNNPTCSLIGTKSKGLKYSSYKDPTNFKQFLFEGVGAKHVSPISSSLDKYQSWSGPFNAISEYMDTFSKTGLSNMKNQQQYLNPLTPWRKRFGDCKLEIP